MSKLARGGALPILAALFVACVVAPAGGSETAEWPCIQPKVPEITAATMWAGPEIDEQDRSWQDSAVIAPLAYRLAQRRLPIDQASDEIDAFAADLKEDANQQLARLFTALLHIINSERKDILAGIERYARQQDVLADEIKALERKLADARAAAAQDEDQQAHLKQMEQQLAWEVRIFSERHGSLSYVCESPVLLEQRLFALARRIMANLR